MEEIEKKVEEIIKNYSTIDGRVYHAEVLAKGLMPLIHNQIVEARIDELEKLKKVATRDKDWHIYLGEITTRITELKKEMKDEA